MFDLILRVGKTHCVQGTNGSCQLHGVSGSDVCGFVSAYITGRAFNCFRFSCELMTNLERSNPWVKSQCISHDNHVHIRTFFSILTFMCKGGAGGRAGHLTKVMDSNPNFFKCILLLSPWARHFSLISYT